MTAPFAALQARTNAAVMRHLANAEAIVGDESIPVLFKRETLVINGIEATHPTCRIQSNEVAAKQIRAGTELRIPSAGQAAYGSQEWWGGTRFTVRGMEPDGTGLTLLILEAP
jgi:hypothetical protein